MSEKRHLLVPDIHEEMQKLKKIEQRFFGDASHITFLSDWFDKWKKDDYGIAAATYVRDHIDDPGMTFLIGNHDASYFFGGPWRCSGYDVDTHRNIRSILDYRDVLKFKVSTRVGKFLVSHAGFHPRTIHLADPDVQEMAIRLAVEEHTWSPMWNVGYFRGGNSPVGGPTWLDWNKEFQAMSQAQIVGHTFDPKHRVRTAVYYAGGAGEPDDDPVTSYCIDTALHHVMWVDEDTDEIEIVEV